MLLLDRQTSAMTESRAGADRANANRAGAPAGAIQLRFSSSGQLVELPPGKATIGSSPRCNVRIEQPGVQPLHCLISDSAGGLRIRSWAANTTLNGRTFEETTLAVGDCLGLGTVELQVVDSVMPQVETAPTSVPTPAVPTAPPVNNEQVRVARDQARARGRRLLESLRLEREAHSEVRTQVARLQESHLDAISEQSELSDKLDGVLAELAAAEQQLGELQAVEVSRRELAERNKQLRFEVGELSGQIDELKKQQLDSVGRRQRFEDEYATLQAQYLQLTDENGRLQGDAERLANDEAAAAERYRQLADQHSQLQAELDRLAEAKSQLTESQNATADESQQLRDANARLQADVLQLANEKAAADDLNQELVKQKDKLLNEVDRLNNQKHELEAEREGLRRHIDTLVGETRSLAGERGSLADERTELYHECGELRQQIESLRLRIAQLNEENSTMAVGKLTLVEERDALGRQIQTLHTQLAALGEENTALAEAKASLAEEQAKVATERKRLEELEREMSAVQAGRESTSAELYRALLQLSELQERDEQSKEVLEAYESLGKERDQFHAEAEKLKSEINRLTEERASIDTAWEELSAEATKLDESHKQLSGENAQLLASLEEARQQLESTPGHKSSLANMTAELEQERAAKQRAESEVAAAQRRFEEQERRFVEQEARLAEQERRFAERAQEFAAQSSQFDDRSERLAEQSLELTDTISSLEEQLANVSEAHGTLLRDREESQARLADAELHQIEQSRRITELELQLAAAEDRAARFAEEAANRMATRAERESAESRGPLADPEVAGESSGNNDHAATSSWKSAYGGSTSDDEFDGEPSFPTGGSPLATLPDITAVGRIDATSEPHDAADENPLVARSSEWAQVAASPVDVYGDPSISRSEQLARADAVVESALAPKSEQASFIDRYSHLFADEDNTEVEKAARPNDLVPEVQREVAARKSVVGSLEPRGNDEDESIEQYMAKLLQRVRGEAAVEFADSPPSLQMPLNDPSSNVAEQTSLVNGTTLEDEVASDDDSAEVAAEPAQIVRRKPVPMPAADLDALRALANETARRAITRHDLKTFRRKAVSKVIVAALAASTSVWLMLASPDWRHWQFFTACGTLLVAAYWLADSYRAFASLRKVGSYERSVARSQGIETFGAPALPIDVEGEE
jgi:chromosome segregation ATPase